MQTVHHVSLTTAAFICNLIFVGISVGGPLLAWLDSHFPIRRQITTYGALGTLILFSMVLYLPQLPVWLVGVLILLIGFTGSAYVLTFVIANEVAPSYMRSTSVGFVNMLSVGSAPLLQPVAGFLLALSSHHGTHYTVHQYQFALTILPIALLIAVILAQYLPSIEDRNALQDDKILITKPKTE